MRRREADRPSGAGGDELLLRATVSQSSLGTLGGNSRVDRGKVISVRPWYWGDWICALEEGFRRRKEMRAPDF